VESSGGVSQRLLCCSYAIIGGGLFGQHSGSVWEAVASSGGLERRVVWVASVFSQVECHRALLDSIFTVFLPDILWLLADSQAKRTTPTKVRKSFHLRAIVCLKDKGALHLVAR
jgi:hypothetical protein